MGKVDQDILIFPAEIKWFGSKGGLEATIAKSSDRLYWQLFGRHIISAQSGKW